MSSDRACLLTCWGRFWEDAVGQLCRMAAERPKGLPLLPVPYSSRQGLFANSTESDDHVQSRQDCRERSIIFNAAYYVDRMSENTNAI